MQRILVSSSNLRSVGYDANEEVLEIKFRDGGTYLYFGVPESIYSRLMAASSKGSFLHRHIKDRYRYRRKY